MARSGQADAICIMWQPDSRGREAQCDGSPGDLDLVGSQPPHSLCEPANGCASWFTVVILDWVMSGAEIPLGGARRPLRIGVVRSAT